MDDICILYAIGAGVCTITLNRPERLNAWTPEMEAAFRHAIERADKDPAVRVIVVTGAGRAFCAGADLGGGKPQITLRPNDDDFDQRYSYLLRTDKPLIAAINGAAIGVGLCLTLYCDLRYAADGAKLGAPFARLGLIAEHGASWMLPRLIGSMNAADLLLTGRTIEVAEAAAMGLVRCLPAENFLGMVIDKARAIATAASPRSTRVIKEQLRGVFRQSLAEAVTVADREQLAAFEADDFREGVAAFLEKRPPAFSGR